MATTTIPTLTTVIRLTQTGANRVRVGGPFAADDVSVIITCPAGYDVDGITAEDIVNDPAITLEGTA